MNWIKALRPFTVIKVGLLTLLCFKISAATIEPIAIVLAIFVTLGAAATMVLNDWFDRKHDLQKGKDFAYLMGNNFLIYAISLWVVVFSLGIWIWARNPEYILISVLLLSLGLFYFVTRHVVALSAIAVSFAGALPTLYAYIAYKESKILGLFVVVFFLMLGRETLKDMQDMHDVGYKKTLPVTFGVRVSKKVVLGVFLIILPFLYMLSIWIGTVTTLFIAFAVFKLFVEGDIKVTKKIMDLASFAVLGLLLIGI